MKDEEIINALKAKNYELKQST